MIVHPPTTGDMLSARVMMTRAIIIAIRYENGGGSARIVRPVFALQDCQSQSNLPASSALP